MRYRLLEGVPEECEDEVIEESGFVGKQRKMPVKMQIHTEQSM